MHHSITNDAVETQLATSLQSVGLRQIEQQDFGVFKAFDDQLRLVSYRGTVAVFKRLPVQLHRSFSDLQPCIAALRQGMGDFLSRRQEGHVQARVLVDSHGTILAVWPGDQAQLAALFFIRKRLLFVAGLMTCPVGHDPNL